VTIVFNLLLPFRRLLHAAGWMSSVKAMPHLPR